MKRNNFWTEIDMFCKTEKIQIMSTVETKTERAPEEGVWRKAGFDHMEWIPARGFSGGLCLLWKEFQLHHVSIEVTTKAERFVTIKYTNPKIQASCFIVFAYAPPRREDKDLFWLLFSD